MSKIIQLTTKPFKTAIAFEITGITVRSLSQDSNGPAEINGVPVFETYDEIIFMLTKVI